MLAYKISPKENVYFAIRLVVTALIVVLIVESLRSYTSTAIAFLVPVLIYTGLIIIYLLIRKVLLVGYIRNNGVRITPNQLPEIHAIYTEQAQKLEIDPLPDLYLLQAGGLLNAFATRFVWTNYVVIYSDILETAYAEGNKAAEFIIGHELGHVQRSHMSKNFLLFPSAIVPFLYPAYSRACETTCDNIGHALCPEGAMKGMLILAAGKSLYNRIDTKAYVENYRTDASFWKWFAEICFSHPPLPKRIENLNTLAPGQTP